jgi:signal transduction histidine kinase
MPDAAHPARTDALDVIVELISELDERPRPGGRGFYDRLCEALCRVVSMRRAGLMLYDEARRLVVPVGSHGVRADLLAAVYGRLDETPIAQLALAEDRVVQVSERLEDWVPARYADFAGLTTLTCTPVAAGGRALGVIFADRGGEPFELSDEERHAMWTLGKTAALAASVRIATNQQGRARLLQARIDLARELHERVVQRLFGISLALGSEQGLSDEGRRRCADELDAALADLRDALERPLAPAAIDSTDTLRGELDRLARHPAEPPLELEWDEGVTVPAELESLAQSVLAEALRNARKHARPTAVRVRVARADGTFELEVRNDGAVAGSRGTGLGLRLAATEALQLGGFVEFGPDPGGRWHVRLVVPVREEERPR